MSKSKLDFTQQRDRAVDERLRTALIAWLVSVKADGGPHAAAVWFFWDGNSIIVFSKPDNQKVKNISRNAKVVIAIDDTQRGDDVITIEGTAELLSSGIVSPTDAGYIAKYADLLQRMSWSAEVMEKSYSQAIRITPTKFIGL